MFAGPRYLLGRALSVFRSRKDLILENLALRQQLLALHATRPRPRLSSRDRLFWVVLRGVWSGWRRSLILVTPETVVRWHRAGFRLYWAWLSGTRRAGGRRQLTKELRRKILHCNVTHQPNALWIVLQLRETWGFEQPHRFLVFDRDAKFSADVISTVQQNGTEPVRTAFRSPWQNGIAERWVGSVRRELLDHVIVLNQRHLKRLLNDYVRYYHEDRTHLGLEKDTPGGRVAASVSPCASKVISLPRLGGLHHRYAAAA